MVCLLVDVDFTVKMISVLVTVTYLLHLKAIESQVSLQMNNDEYGCTYVGIERESQVITVIRHVTFDDMYNPHRRSIVIHATGEVIAPAQFLFARISR